MLKYRFVGFLDGRVAVVTGAGRGLGRAHALALAAEGASVLVNDVDGAAASAVVGEIVVAGGRATRDATDLSSFDAASYLVERCAALLGRVDVLVNNAGVSVPTSVEDLTEEMLDRHLDVHVKGTVATTRAAFPLMRAQGGGCIVNTTSGHGLDPVSPHSAAYATAKAAVFGFTRAAALEGRPHGIRVNAIAPLAYTRMSAEYLSRVEGAAERLDPAHVARFVVWLASDDAADVTGAVYRVEGSRVSEWRVEAARGS